MSTIYVFHQECPALSGDVAAGDIFLLYDTSTATVVRATAAQVAAGMSVGTNQGYATTTATGTSTTLNALAGQVTTVAQTVTQTGTYSLTVTNSYVTSTSIVHVGLQNGTNTLGFPLLSRVTPAAGAFTATWTAADTTQALSGTLKMDFVVLAQ